MARPAPSITSLRRRLAAGLLGSCALVVVACGAGGSTIGFDTSTATSPSGAGTAAAGSPSVPPPSGGGGGGGAGGGRFVTLPVGAVLPDDASCAARVRRGGAEVRAANAGFNQTKGHPTPATADPNYPLYRRVTGNFTGTTDEIIQWTACKWGIDEDVVRAQAAKETYWFQKNVGDFSSDPTRCVPGHPIGADGQPGQCPESIGIMQIRYPYFKTTITDAIASTAYNLDLAYAVWRTCYEGGEAWLNNVERGRQYTPGDQWGCVGRWLTGRWYTPQALTYIADVQNYNNQHIWQTPGFINYQE